MSSRKKLKKGFTTGSAAAAAAKAALFYLLSQKKKKTVKIRFLTGEETSISIYKTKKILKNKAESIVIKDAGDDPDVTHKAEIGARVSIFPMKYHEKCNNNPNTCNFNDVKTGKYGKTETTPPTAATGGSILPVNYNNNRNIIIKGGSGVGMVTKPGLEVACGKPAINPGPQKMIIESVNAALDFFKKKGKIKVEVEIFVPAGEELAKKTLNSRLGIKGGISILGTTGIVKPMSHDAYVATIKYGISVAGAMGSDTLVFTTGRRSERFAMEIFPDFREDAFIQIGDFFQASLVEAEAAKPIKNIIITVFFGKAVKMAMGFGHTHAAKSKLTMQKLANWAQSLKTDSVIIEKIARSNTARHAFTYIYPDYPEIISCVGKKIIKSANGFSHSKLKIRVIIFDFEGTVVFDSL